ncbi:uncharacterized protein [Ptychodera flava]|uniref:uncharacterized protein n=1 Tax=Ptychodera flava TaxID=63121 RepID=UPI003969E868
MHGFLPVIVTSVCFFSHAVLCIHGPIIGKDECLTPNRPPIERVRCYLDKFNVNNELGERKDQSRPLPLLRALKSPNVQVSTVRSMMTNYLVDHNLENQLPLAMANIRTMDRRREYLADTLLFLSTLEDEMTKAVSELQKEREDRVYTFQIQPGCNCSLYYMDDDGIMKGFFIDFLEAVCREAGKLCKLQEHPFTGCIDGDGSGSLVGGKGLLGKQYDACFLVKSSEMNNIFSSTDIFLNYDGSSQFFVRKGNPRNFDPRNITGKKIVFLKGWQSNYRCLITNNVTGANTLHYEPIIVEFTELHSYVQKHEVDAIFSLEKAVGEGSDRHLEMFVGTPEGFEPIGDIMKCVDGFCVMSRKDSPVIGWFNETFLKMKKNGKYAKLCRDGQIKHGKKGRLDCVN